MGKTNKQYGLWQSKITPDLLATARRLSDFNFGAAELVFWLEGRSDRSQIYYADWSQPDAARELSPNVSCKAKLGYGGGDFTTCNNTVFFCERTSGRLFRQNSGDMNPVALTPRFGAIASPVVSPDGRFVAYVHQDEDDIDRIAVVDAEGKCWPQILESGADFYTQLRFSPDGQSFAFVSWCHPHMPWESSALFVGKLAYTEGGLPRLQQIRKVAGGPGRAVFQPEFSPDSKSLLYVSDESGFGHLYQQDLESGKLRALTSGEDYELGMPNWVQDMRTYALAEGGRTIVTAVNRQGFIQLHTIDWETRKMELVGELADYTEVNRVVASADGTRVLIGASAADKPSVVIGLDLRSRQKRVFARSVDICFAAEDMAKPQAVTWRTDKLEACHGLLYQPASSRYTCSTGKPPLIVLIHGGPTAQATAKFNLEIQYFTSRGYAVLAVNYRGSTGYGRAYMEKLNGQWGVADVDDAVFGLRHFADSGVIDGKRSVIMGGSAGGYTVLQTMVAEPEAFAAGISLYGIANQFALSKDTHKFEAHYNDSLLGPLPEAAAIYRERSPEFHAGKIRRPLAIFQGDQDKVVPKNQAEAIVKGLAKNGVPHIYHVYEGEGHGFRKAETIRHLYTAIESFIQDYVLFR
jgi:dipeptidyl aminopeptidase/acylaminoacyl peptidase